MRRNITLTILLIIILIFTLPIYAEVENIDAEAKIVKNNGIEEIEQENGDIKKTQKVTIRILEGEFKNEEYDMEYILTEDSEDMTAKTELDEKDKIIINLSEENGEVVSVEYKEMLSQNYILYIALGVVFLALLFVGKGKIIKPTLKCITIVGVTFGLLILGIYKEWNLIIITSIISVIITILSCLFSVKRDRNVIPHIICTLLGISIFGILSYMFFNEMNISNTMLNIQISDIFINIKQLLCSMTILICCGVCNIISIIYIYREKVEKSYADIKSKNILEGQRSLKL